MSPREPLLIDTPSRHVASAPASVERCTALWLDLVSGKLEVALASAEPGRAIVILRARSTPSRPLAARAIEATERTLLGERRKVIAHDMGFSVSMLALVLKASLVSLGLDGKPSRASAALVMLIHGARGAGAPCGTFIGDCDHAGERLTVITHLFDESVLCGLSPSQRAVMLMVANGRSCAHIAARRNRSGRTVINQIAAASRRLGISGRFELLRCLATGRAEGRVSRGASRRSTDRVVQIPPRSGVETSRSMCG